MSEIALNNKESEIILQFEKTIKEINHEDIIIALQDGLKKLKKLDFKPPRVLLEIWDDIKMMLFMIKDYVSGNYTDVSWKTIATISAAIIYFISPLDLIPDPIPLIGYLDDLTILKLALKITDIEFKKYKKWREKL